MFSISLVSDRQNHRNPLRVSEASSPGVLPPLWCPKNQKIKLHTALKNIKRNNTGHISGTAGHNNCENFEETEEREFFFRLYGKKYHERFQKWTTKEAYYMRNLP